jgi:PAS domain S-box-containing protein
MPTSTQIKQEIIERLGFFPAFFAPAIATPQVLLSLWQQTWSTYVNNPLPALFKEKLFVYVSRYCSIPYFTICHSCILRSLGMTATEILELHRYSLPISEADLKRDIAYLNQNSAYRSHWQTNPKLEESVLRCSAFLFLQPALAEVCRTKMRQFLGIPMYNHLTALLSYIKLCHHWLENNPEISYEQDQRAQLHLAPLLLEKLDLAEFFQKKGNNRISISIAPNNPSEVSNPSFSMQDANLCKERFRICFINAPFPMMIHDSDGKILHLNKSWTEITGYGAEDIPTLVDWTRQAQVKRQEIVRSCNIQIEAEVAFHRVVNSLLNLPYNLDPKIEFENSELELATRSEVTVITSSGEKRFWDFYSAPLARFPNGRELMISMARDITNSIRIEAELKEVESRLQLLEEATNSGNWVCNLETDIVNIDDRACQLFGLEKNSFNGNYESFLQSIHPSERQSIDLAFIKAVKTKKDLDIEYRVIWADNSIHWLRVKGKLVYDEFNNPNGIKGMVIEITQSKQAQQQLQQIHQYEQQDLVQSLNSLTSLLNLLPSALLVLEKNSQNISFCNQLMAESLGFETPQQVQGKTISECFSPENREKLLQQGNSVWRAKETLRQLQTISLVDGYHQYDTVIIPLPKTEEAVEALLYVFNEVPDLVATKKALSERSVQLEAANRELESFSYSVSHDLQTPLRIINGFSQVLWERYGDRLDQQGKHYLQRIRANSDRMNELIDALLQLSQLTRSQMQCTQIDLSIVAQEIIAELQATQPERKVEFQIASGLVANGDPRLLRIVLNNLLNNAWKYTSKTSSASIEFNTISEPNKPLTYFVRDNGAGFNQAYAHKLFVPFQRLHSELEFPGTGIGLATVQRIIHRHGGKVWAEGDFNQGAVFYFCL